VSKTSSAAERIVGRDAQLASLEEFLAADAAPRALTLTGGPGVGKTSLWEAGVEAARRRGLRVLRASGSGAETRLSFAALIDLLDGIDLAELEGLPAPQRRALDVALYREDSAGAPPDTSAIALGLLGALRALAAEQPLLVALDDLQWVDEASGEALAFVARRVDAEPVAFLLARRPGPASALERALGERVESVGVGTLSIGAMRRMLSERLGLSLSRHVLRRVYEATLGNPLFSLEMGRAIAASGAPALTEDVPLPDAVEELLGTRIAQLDPSVRRLMLALALDSDLRVSRLAAIADQAVLEDALDTGVVVVEGDRIRPAHPLLAAAAKSGSRARERRALHLQLAEVAADDELRALHLAMATQLPDAALADAVAAAAAAASARGSAQQAVVLADHALRLTPADSDRRSERILVLAGYLEVAGERQRVTDLLLPELDSLSRRDRVRAWMRLSEGAITGNYDTVEYLERALAECSDDPELRAHVLAKKAALVPNYLKGIADAEAWALEALPAAKRAGPELERAALHGLGWARAMQGKPIDDVCARFRACSEAAAHITDSPEPVEALRLLWRGHVDAARTMLRDFLALSDARGEEVSYALQRLNLCDLELRAGNWRAAELLLDEWEAADRKLLIRETYLRVRALLACGRGFAEEAKSLAAESLAGAEPRGYYWQTCEARRALGLAALLAHEPDRAAEELGWVWEHMHRERIDEPGAFPVAPDLVEALVTLDRLEEARQVTQRLRDLSEAQEHPWGLAGTKRSTALVQGSADGLAEAADAYAELGLHFDRARTHLILGKVQRRMKQWRAAREALEQAVAEFGELDSPGWVDEARSELSRVGGRRRQDPGELTPTERRVAELAADGLANKEIASTLFVTVRTVEEHLRNAYAKLGIRSRTQLARRLSEPT